MKYWTEVWIAIDQLANALFKGWADETISSRAHRELPTAEKVINAIFFWQKEHCKGAYESEKARKHLPPELRV